MAVAGLALTGCSSPTAPSAPPAAPNPTPQLSLTCPGATSAGSLHGGPVPVSFGQPAAAGGREPIQVSCTPASGTPFPIGTTTVQCTATDAVLQTASCSFAVTVAVVPRLSHTKFLAFGDSFTAGEIGVPTGQRLADGTPVFALAVVPGNSYPTQLTTLLRARYVGQVEQIAVVNAGLPGELTEDGVKRLPGVMRSAAPDVLLLLEGINDLNTYGAAGVSKAALGVDMMAKEGRYRGARVFVATLAPAGTGPKAPPATLISQLNARIRDTARGEGAVLVDVHAALAADIARYMGPDGLHPNAAGYQKMADTFYDAIRAAFESR